MEMCDLMPQDWVRNDLGEIQQVVELRESGAMLAYNDIYPYDAIEPIPITADILQKNGFVKSDSKWHNEDLWELHEEPVKGRCPFLRIQIVLPTKPIDGASVLISILASGKYSTNEFRTCDFTAIHELQHALKACGIKKEFVF